jgi:hypothetical protein
MRTLMKNISSRSLYSILLSIAALSPLQVVSPVLAQANLTYQGANIYKDSKNNVYVVTSSDLNVSYNGVNVSKSLYSDACGWTVLKLSDATSSTPTTIDFNSASDSIGSIPTTASTYKCVSGVVQWKGTPQTALFKTVRAPAEVTTTTIYYPPSRTGGANRQGLVAYTANLTKKVKANSCGFASFSTEANSRRQTSGSLTIGYSPIALASLPVNPTPPDCVKGQALTSGSAVATYNGATLYRTDKAIYFTGLTPGSLNVVGYDALSSQTVSVLPEASACGIFKFKYSQNKIPAAIKVGTMTYTTDNLTLRSGSPFYTCANFSASGLQADTLHKVNGTEYYYKVSDLNIKRLTAEVPTISTSNVAVNACGFAVIPALNKANGFTAGDKVTINGSTPYDVSTLPLAPSAPTCKNGAVYRAQ